MDTSAGRAERLKPARKPWISFVVGMGTALLVALMSLVVYFCLKDGDIVPVKKLYRLPRSVFPTSYQLDIRTYFPLTDEEISEQLNFTFDGRLVIRLRCVDNTSNVTMHSSRLTINESSLSVISDSDGLEVPLASPALKTDSSNEVVAFLFLSELQAGQNYTLTLEYAGKLSDDLRGFYRTSYMKDGSKRWLLVTQFEPTDARRALPCFDEPDFKAVFNVSLEHPSSTTALSNMPAVQEQKLGGNWKRTTFKPTVPMSTYLLAFAVSDYSVVSGANGSEVKFNVWARDSQLNQTNFALDAGPIVLKYYARMYNYSFPLPKLDMIAIPDFAAGAMENWGLITFREVDLLLDEGKWPAMMSKLRVAHVIAHELAHQWFGNLVTMKWWDSIWLNEGFADYVCFEAAQQVLCEWPGELDKQFVYEQVQMAMAQDELPNSPPIHRTSAHTDLHLYFDSITYKKGSSIIRMLHKVLRDVFEKGLSIYMKKNAFRNVDDDDLWDALQQAVDEESAPPTDWNGEKLNVSAFMSNWINLAGFPVVIITRVNDSAVKLSQERSLSNLYGSGVNGSSGQHWYIPLWYVTCSTGDTEQFLWLQPNKEAFLNISADCEFLVNDGVRSFVRILYPPSQTPTKFLNTSLMKNISIVNRAQLIDDAFNLAKANLTSYEQSLDVPLLLLENNSHPVPLKAAFLGYEFLNLMFITSPEEHNLLTNFVSKYVIRYDNTLWSLAASSSDYADHTRSEFLIEKACRWNSSDCISDAKLKFDDFLSSCNDSRLGTTECSPVPTALRKTVYCAGVSADEDNFGKLWRWCQLERFSSERGNLLAGLSCSKQSSSLHRLLNASLRLDTDCIKLQDISTLLSYISANPLGRSLLWPFMQEHWREYMDKDMKNSLRTMASQSVSAFNTESDVARVEEFLSRPEVAPQKAFFAKPFESVKANKLWRDRYFSIIVDWLKMH